MSLNTKILGTACALALGALAAGPAMAGFSGTLDGEYANLSTSGGGGNADMYGFNGSGAFDLGPSFGLQLDGGYRNLSSHGSSADNWNIGGTPFWRFSQGRIGAVVNYTELSAGSLSINATNYGAYGEWFASPMFTLGVKGGGFSGTSGLSGSYFGGQVKAYVMPDFSVAGTIDYASLSHSGNETDYGVRAEYLISESTPVSVFAGYTYSDLSGSGPHFDTWMVGLKFYCNGTPATTLADRERSGNVGWASKFQPLFLNF